MPRRAASSRRRASCVVLEGEESSFGSVPSADVELVGGCLPAARGSGDRRLARSDALDDAPEGRLSELSHRTTRGGRPGCCCRRTSVGAGDGSLGCSGPAEAPGRAGCGSPRTTPASRVEEKVRSGGKETGKVQPPKRISNSRPDPDRRSRRPAGPATVWSSSRLWLASVGRARKRRTRAERGRELAASDGGLDEMLAAVAMGGRGETTVAQRGDGRTRTRGAEGGPLDEGGGAERRELLLLLLLLLVGRTRTRTRYGRSPLVRLGSPPQTGTCFCFCRLSLVVRTGLGRRLSPGRPSCLDPADGRPPRLVPLHRPAGREGATPPPAKPPRAIVQASRHAGRRVCTPGPSLAARAGRWGAGDGWLVHQRRSKRESEILLWRSQEKETSACRWKSATDGQVL